VGATLVALGAARSLSRNAIINSSFLYKKIRIVPRATKVAPTKELKTGTSLTNELDNQPQLQSQCYS